MKQRITATIIALMAIVISAMSQPLLSVQSVEVQKGEQAELVVTLNGTFSWPSAIQFNLKLPEGVVLDESAIKKSASVSGHELAVRTLENGDRLFVLYSMDLNTFGNGELLRLPITAGNEAGTANCKIYNVRTATPDAVSRAGYGASFQITVTNKATGIDGLTPNPSPKGEGSYYSLDGKKLSGEPTKKGIYIRNGKNIVK